MSWLGDVSVCWLWYGEGLVLYDRGYVGYGGLGRMMCWGHMDVGGVVDGI